VSDLTVAGPLVNLRYATPADAERLFELASDPEVTRFFSWGPYKEIGEAHAYIEGLAGERDRGFRLDFVIDHSEHGVVGVTGLTELSQRDRRAVVGTWLGQRYWGSGANAASKALICALAFRGLGLERLSAYAAVDNPRSQTALGRIGFKREGTLRSWHRHGDVVHDVEIHGLLREEWEESGLSREPAEISGEPPGPWALES
jgi:ribosomal-protein-alanine N-acetyltransferase